MNDDKQSIAVQFTWRGNRIDCSFFVESKERASFPNSGWKKESWEIKLTIRVKIPRLIAPAKGKS